MTPRFSGAGRGGSRPSGGAPPGPGRGHLAFPPPGTARSLLFCARMRSLLTLALAVGSLLGSPLGARAADERGQAVAELAALAPRIEALKREAQAGRGDPGELLRLLVRAQVLADRLDGRAAAVPPSGAPGPDARELRERADALRDRADRLAAAMASAEARLRTARREGELAETLERVSGEADPFAEGTALRRASAPPAAASTAPPTGPVTPFAPSSGDAAAPSRTAGGLPVPPPQLPGPAGWAARGDAAATDLLPADGDDLRTLRRKRAALGAARAALEAQARSLDAEAQALDAGR